MPEVTSIGGLNYISGSDIDRNNDWIPISHGNDTYRTSPNDLYGTGSSSTSSSYSDSSSYAITASFALNVGGTIDTSSFIIAAQTSSMTVLSASYAENSQTASYVLNAVSSSFASTSKTASYALDSNLKFSTFINTGSTNTNQSITGSLLVTQNLTVLGSASIAYITASQTIVNQNTLTTYADGIGLPEGGYIVADSSSIYPSSSLFFNIITQKWRLDKPLVGSLEGTSSFSHTASFVNNAQTASYVVNAQTSSYTSNAVSSSYAITASFSQNTDTSFLIRSSQTSSMNVLSASFAISSSRATNANTASYVATAQTASYVLNAISASRAVTASYAQTSSYIVTAQTASYVLNAVSSSFAISSSRAVSSSFSTTSNTSSYVVTAQTASYVITAQTASYVNLANTASFVIIAQTASYVLNAISSSRAVTASYVVSSSFATTASYALNAPGTVDTSSFVQVSQTASMSVLNAISSSRAQTASFVTTSQTASFVTTAQTASYVLNSVSSSFAQTASYLPNNGYIQYSLNDFSGSNFGARLQLAINTVPSGSIIDCFLISGSQSITSSITIGKPITILLGKTDITANVGTNKNVFEITSNNIQIIGRGRASKSSEPGQTRILMTNSGQGYHINLTHSGSFITGSNVIKIQDLDLIGVESTQFTTDGSGGIFLAEQDPYQSGGGNALNQVIIEGVYIEKTKAHAITLLGLILSSINNTRISQAGGHGVYVDSSSTSTIISNTYVSSALLAGFCLNGNSYSNLINCAAEGAGIGYWIRSCFNTVLTGCGAESNETRITAPSSSLGIQVSSSAGMQTISDIGSDYKTLFKGHSYVVTGGRNITMIAPYSMLPGRPYPTTGSLNSRHFLIKGTTKNALIQSPRITGTFSGSFDIGVELNGAETPRDIEFVFNPSEDGTITGTTNTNAGIWITTSSLAAESTVILDQGDNTLVRAGNKIYSNYIIATGSALPTWVGQEGEIKPVKIGSNYFMATYIGGAWRSSSLF